MLDAIGASQMAMNLDQLKLQSITQNIANINTPGFKKTSMEHLGFDEHLQSSSITHALDQLIQEPINTQGSLIQTDKTTDLALSGDAYFQVHNEHGIYYTKRGDCHINNKGELVTAHDDLIMTQSGALQVDDAAFVIDRQGTVFIDHHKAAQLNIVTANSAQQMRYVGNGLYQCDEALAPADGNTQVLQGFIEQANVTSIDEMMDLTRIARHFETNQRVLRTADSLLATAINQLGESNV